MICRAQGEIPVSIPPAAFLYAECLPKRVVRRRDATPPRARRPVV
jgi:hypothetical protein